MRKALLTALGILLALIFTASSVYGFPAQQIEKNVVYFNCDNKGISMDLYYPQTSGLPLPVILYIHGGGWFSGDKSDGIGLQDIPELNKRGYLVAAVNYRLAPRYKFPAQIEDIERSVRFLRANANIYGLDPSRIGVFGESAGGHLASLLGLKDCDCGCAGEHTDQSIRVKAVVDMFGPTDLTMMFEQEWSMLIEHVFDVSDPSCETIKRASPITYVSKDDPPFLIIHGANDDTVLLNQSKELFERLVSNEVQADLLIVNNCGHGFTSVGGPISPPRVEITMIIADFFDRYLK